MSDNSEVPSYIARCNCGCGGIVLATVDTPEHAKEVAKEVATCIKKGYAVERVTVGYVRQFSGEHGFGCLAKRGLTPRAVDLRDSPTLPGLSQPEG